MHVNTDINIHSIGESLYTTTLITDMDKEAITESKREEETIKSRIKDFKSRHSKYIYEEKEICSSINNSNNDDIVESSN